jgi:hypothetical protein
VIDVGEIDGDEMLTFTPHEGFEPPPTPELAEAGE